MTEKDFIKFYEFENQEYKYNEVEISDIFFLHIIHSNEEGTYYSFDFLPVFKYGREHGIGHSFDYTFYEYLEKNKTDVFTIEEKYSNGKTEKILYVVDKDKKFRFLDEEIKNPGIYGIYHCISESFYSVLLNSNPCITEVYLTYVNQKKPLQHFDERV